MVAVATLFGMSAYGQNIDGYFRVQNAQSGNYVQVRGAFTAQPDQNFEYARSEAGSVMLIKAVPDPSARGVYRIENLRCQGIEVVGEPMTDYFNQLKDILADGNFNNSHEALWTLVRAGFQNGYTSIGRAVLQTMICVVASRLDEEGFSDKDAKELANFADRFNREVAAEIDLGIRLESTGGDGQYRLFYDVPDLECVSQWYLKDENKATFEKGFEAMRHYLTGKIGATGEGLDASEIAEMKSWGYDPTVKHPYDPALGISMVKYEDIFADHELLYNWLKLNMIKFTDEERCPKIELMGYYLPNFAKEMKKHALTAQLIGYFPRLKTNERVYLTDGKNGVFGHLDFTSVAGAEALGDGARWNLCEVTADDGSYLAFPAVEGANYYDVKTHMATAYTAVYLDFPVKAVNPSATRLYELAEEPYQVNYMANIPTGDPRNSETVMLYEMREVTETKAQTPVLIEMTTSEVSNHRLLPVYTTTLPEAVKPLPDHIFEVTDEVVGSQRSMRKASAKPMNYIHGVLLPNAITADAFSNQAGTAYDHASAPVHRLGQIFKSVSGGHVETVGFSPAMEGDMLRPNEAFLVMPHSSSTIGGYAIKVPNLDDATGIEGVETDAAKGADAIFDLKGNRVNRMNRGEIYIFNGKKVLAF